MRKLQVMTFFSALLLSVPCVYTQEIASLPSVRVKDIGVIGLSSHDMFTWDRKSEVNLENGRLDLSTIFDYDSGKL